MGETMAGVRVWSGMAVVAILASACSNESVGDDARGRGHAVAELPEPKVLSAYASALRAAFDPSPDLHVLAEPTYLPRSSGYGVGDSVPTRLLSELQRSGVVQGRCTPERASERRAPTCAARRPGYVARFSPLFQLGGDTVEVYLQSEIYAPSAGAGQQPFSFEMAYQLVPTAQRWRVIREGRVRQSGAAR